MLRKHTGKNAQVIIQTEREHNNQREFGVFSSFVLTLMSRPAAARKQVRFFEKHVYG